MIIRGRTRLKIDLKRNEPFVLQHEVRDRLHARQVMINQR